MDDFDKFVVAYLTQSIEPYKYVKPVYDGREFVIEAKTYAIAKLDDHTDRVTLTYRGVTLTFQTSIRLQTAHIVWAPRILYMFPTHHTHIANTTQHRRVTQEYMLQFKHDVDRIEWSHPGVHINRATDETGKWMNIRIKWEEENETHYYCNPNSVYITKELATGTIHVDSERPPRFGVYISVTDDADILIERNIDGWPNPANTNLITFVREGDNLHISASLSLPRIQDGLLDKFRSQIYAPTQTLINVPGYGINSLEHCQIHATITNRIIALFLNWQYLEDIDQHVYLRFNDLAGVFEYSPIPGLPYRAVSEESILIPFPVLQLRRKIAVDIVGRVAELEAMPIMKRSNTQFDEHIRLLQTVRNIRVPFSLACHVCGKIGATHSIMERHAICERCTAFNFHRILLRL